MRVAPCVPVLLLGFVLPAQQTATIPAAQANLEGDSRFELAGLHFRGRQQVLVAASHLGALAGRSLEALVFRRDGDPSHAFQAGESDLSVFLSSTTVAPEGIRATFALNHGANRVQAFQGRVALPASLAAGTNRWSVDQTLRITLQQPFVHSGGNLCVEILGAPVVGKESRYWWLDGMLAQHDGVAATVGSAALTAGNIAPRLDLTRPATVPGEGLDFLAKGVANTPAFLLLGGPQIPGGLDLALLGMPGYRLYVDPAAVLPMAIDAARFGTATAPWGSGRIRIEVPAVASLLAGIVHAQMLDLEVAPPFSNPLHLVASPGLRVTLASTFATLGLASVSTAAVSSTGPWPESGVQATNQGPVFQALWR